MAKSYFSRSGSGSASGGDVEADEVEKAGEKEPPVAPVRRDHQQRDAPVKRPTLGVEYGHLEKNDRNDDVKTELKQKPGICLDIRKEWNIEIGSVFDVNPACRADHGYAAPEDQEQEGHLEQVETPGGKRMEETDCQNCHSRGDDAGADDVQPMLLLEKPSADPDDPETEVRQQDRSQEEE